MKKEQFIEEVIQVYQDIRYKSISSVKVGSIVSKDSAMLLAIEAVKQDIEYKKELLNTLNLRKEIEQWQKVKKEL